MPTGQPILRVARWAWWVPLAAALSFASVVQADLPPMPFSAEPARVVETQIVASGLGLPAEHGNRTSARRQARERAESRARESLVRYVDGQMSRNRVRPAMAFRAHQVLRARTVTAGQRPLVDGAVVVRVSVSIEELRRLAGLQLDWTQP